MLETYFAARATLLKAADLQVGVRQLSIQIHMGSAQVIGLRNKMVEEGLVEVSASPPSGPGRPKELVRPTALGREYLKAYDLLVSRVLKSRKSDLLRAAADGAYARRLSSRGVSTVELFLRLNSVAWLPRETAR